MKEDRNVGLKLEYDRLLQEYQVLLAAKWSFPFVIFGILLSALPTYFAFNYGDSFTVAIIGLAISWRIISNKEIDKFNETAEIQRLLMR